MIEFALIIKFSSYLNEHPKGLQVSEWYLFQQLCLGQVIVSEKLPRSSHIYLYFFFKYLYFYFTFFLRAPDLFIYLFI